MEGRERERMAEDVATTAGEGSLETTPTWAVATLCFSLILISTLIEHGLHLLAKVCLRIHELNITIHAVPYLFGFLVL